MNALPDVPCPECGSNGPWLFVKYNARGAIVECRAVVKGWRICRQRVQVDDPRIVDEEVVRRGEAG